MDKHERREVDASASAFDRGAALACSGIRCGTLQGFVQQAWTSSLAGDRGYAALACFEPSSAFCSVFYSRPGTSYWQAIADMLQSLALGMRSNAFSFQ